MQTTSKMAIETIEQNIRSIQEIVDSYNKILQSGDEKQIQEKRDYILKLVSNIKKLIKEEIFIIRKGHGKITRINQ